MTVFCSVIPAHAGIYLFLLTAESRQLRAKYQIPELRFAPSGMTRENCSVRNDRVFAVIPVYAGIYLFMLIAESQIPDS
jgi:hypothetical protein